MPMRPRGLALLVGIDRYPNFEAHQLESCANDARLVAGVLRERFGFPEDGLTLLLDQAATRDGILAGLAALKDRARAGDRLVVFYSGHGSQVPDEEGDEPDGWDEAIVPHDGGPRTDAKGVRTAHQCRYITDDEIYRWVLDTSAVTPFITFVADTCFAGTLTRGRMKWIPREPWTVAERQPSALGATRLPRRGDAAAKSFLPPSDRYVLLAACRAGESAGVRRGEPGVPRLSTFTYHLCRELERQPAGATYRDLLPPLRAAVVADNPEQTPQLEGARDRTLFGGAVREPVPYLEVLERSGGRLRIGGGAVQGVTPGSRWAITPAPPPAPGAAPPPPLGLALVDRVEAVSSAAEIIEEHAPIAAGQRAVERAKGPGWMRLMVAVTAGAARLPGGAAIASQIVASPLLLLVDDLERAEVRIEAQPPCRPESKERPAVPPRGDAAEGWAWVAQSGDGELLLPPTPASPARVSALVADLERRARYRNLLGLADEDLTNPLRGCLDVELLLSPAPDEVRPSATEPAAGGAVYQEGDRLALRIVQRFTAPLFVHVLDLGLTGAITPMYPVAGANEALGCCRKLLIGVRAGDEMKVSLPPAFPALVRARGRQAVEGREFLKIFATTHETDLTWWRQRSYGAERAGGPGAALRSRLDRVLWRAAHGARLRDDAAARPGEHWTVLTVDFLVRG